jgi:hypothetical protein
MFSIGDFEPSEDGVVVRAAVPVRNDLGPRAGFAIVDLPPILADRSDS